MPRSVNGCPRNRVRYSGPRASTPATSTTTSRPASATTARAFDSCVRALRTGDVLVVWKLDRLGRTLAHLVNTVQDLSTTTAMGPAGARLRAQGAQFIDTTDRRRPPRIRHTSRCAGRVRAGADPRNAPWPGFTFCRAGALACNGGRTFAHVEGPGAAGLMISRDRTDRVYVTGRSASSVFFGELGINPVTLYRCVAGPAARARREGPRPVTRVCDVT